MAQCMKVFSTNPDNVGVISRNHIIEKIDSCKFSSDFYVRAMTSMHLYTHRIMYVCVCHIYML